MKNSMILDYFYGQTGELFSFYRIPKALFQEPRLQSLSTDAKTLYGILLDRMSLSVKNGWLDEQNRVFIIFTIEDVKRALCCADNKATKLLRELEKFGLIERKRRGLGKPSLVYVKNFSAELSYQLVVSEKPSVGAAYAKVLGATNRQDGYWEGNGYLVSWCVGHLVELAPPNVYDTKYVKWSIADLPILPQKWQYLVSASTKKQFGILKKLMHRPDVDSVICATDAG